MVSPLDVRRSFSREAKAWSSKKKKKNIQEPP